MRRKTGDLAAQFGTNRTTRASHQDRPVAQQSMQPRLIQRNALTPQQVFQFNAANLRDADLAGKQVIHGRHGQHRQSRRRGLFSHAPAHTDRHVRHRNNHMLHAQRRGRLCHFGQPPKYRHVMHPTAHLATVIVQKTNDAPFMRSMQCAQQICTRAARTKHQ